MAATQRPRGEEEAAAMGRRGGKLGWAAMAKEATSNTTCLWLCSIAVRRGETR
jgi:hypothetical protein